MLYDIKKIVRVYIRGFYKFCESNNLISENVEELYDLFSFSLNKIYDLDSSEYNALIMDYGKECILSLKKLRNVPKKPTKLSLVDRVAITSMSKAYFVAIQLLSNENEDVVVS